MILFGISLQGRIKNINTHIIFIRFSCKPYTALIYLTRHFNSFYRLFLGAHSHTHTHELVILFYYFKLLNPSELYNCIPTLKQKQLYSQKYNTTCSICLYKHSTRLTELPHKSISQTLKFYLTHLRSHIIIIFLI